MDALIGPGVEVVKCAGSPFLRQIGYLLQYKKNVKKLKRRVEELNNTRTELQRRVDEAENNLESIKKSVVDWFESVKSVEKETTQVETVLRLLNDEAMYERINQQCCKGGWCCLRARWNIGRDAQKMMVIIDELLTQGKNIGYNVSDPSPPVGTEFIPTNKDFENFSSRKSALNQIIAALKDRNTNIVGVYGMAGVGKTMLVNEAYKLVMQDKLFDAVAMTTISENAQVKDIQNEIAKQLGLERLQATDNISTRAEMLRVRLNMPNKKFLVILDDFWLMDVDLSDVGIPGEEETHCKVVITTKGLDLCNSLKSQKNVQVTVLSKEESWHLFNKNIDNDVVNSPALYIVARDIVKECGDLPIALVTLGRALRKKEVIVWKDTLKQLRSCDISRTIRGINSKVFKSIKLSYDHLGYEAFKNLFLVCCLFPRAQRISTDELMMHVLGDYEILEGMETLKEARGRLNTMLDKLVASCLLFGRKQTDGGISHVWMHNIIHSVALSIAAEEGSGFFAEVGVGLKYWPTNRRLLSSTSTRKCLRMSLMRNKISVDSLILNNCKNLKNVGQLLSDVGLKNMKALFVAEIFHDPMSTTGLLFGMSKGLPLESLQNLKVMEVTYCKGLKYLLSPAMAQSLSQLERLDISECNGMVTIISSDISVDQALLHHNTEKAATTASTSTVNISPSPPLLPNLIELMIQGCANLKHLFELYPMTKLDHGSFKRLELLKVTDCRSLEDIINICSMEDKDDEIEVEHQLGEMHLENLPNLVTVWNGVIPINGSFGKLDKLTVVKCNRMKQLVIGGISKLRFLDVKECESLEEIIVADEAAHVFLPQLKTIELEFLPNLTTIAKGSIPLESFKKLRRLLIERCDTMKHVFPMRLLVHGGLSSLEHLFIISCEKLETVFSVEGEAERQDHRVNISAVLPQLSVLGIYGLLPKFSRLYQGKSIVRWPNTLGRLTWEGSLKVIGDDHTLKRIGYPYPSCHDPEFTIHRRPRESLNPVKTTNSMERLEYFYISQDGEYYEIVEPLRNNEARN